VDDMVRNDAEWLYKEYPKFCAPNDFWGQVKRTVHGAAVSQDQIDMIVNSIRKGLKLNENSDVLLDIGCGNGALSQYFFCNCKSMLGVDYSSYLIRVAKENFEQTPSFLFTEADVATYVISEPDPQRFTKVLCYGAFSYFSPDVAKTMLDVFRARFINIKTIFLGNLPDRDRIQNFYPPGTDYRELINDHRSPVGIWRSKEQIRQLSEETGWCADFYKKQDEFYAAHYRYDAILRHQD